MPKQKETIIFPSRILKQVGKVERVENLLVKKPLALIPSFCESHTTCLTKENDQNPFIVLDFGKEIYGGIRIVFEHLSPNDLNIRLVFGESVTECLTNVGERGSNNPSASRDFTVTVANLSIREFMRQGFRFVKIELLEKGSMWLKNIVAVLKTEAYPQIGYIKTSDDELNKIYDTAVYTCFLNAQEGIIWDGIKRDKLIWCGDLNTEILTLAYTYGAIDNIKNCLTILRDESREDCWMNGIPSYSVWWITNFVDYYLLSGDTKFVEESVGFVNNILNELNICISKDKIDFFATGKSTDMEFFLDWQTFETPDAICGTATLIYYTMNKLIEAKINGINIDYAKNIRLNLQGWLTKESSKKQVVALQVLCDGTLKNARQTLENDGARGFSTFTSYFLLKALSKCKSQKIISLIKEYFGGMLSKGATTFWEDFNVDWIKGSGRIDEETPPTLKDIHADFGDYCYKGLKHSLCHGWSSGVVGFMTEEILGVKIIESGFKKIYVKPNLMGLNWVEASVPTPYGNIFIRVENEKIVKLNLPKGVELLKD